MSEVTHITVKLDKRTKALFLELCRKEGIDVSQGVRDLILEALARDFIIRERKERLQKIKGGVNA